MPSGASTAIVLRALCRPNKWLSEDQTSICTVMVAGSVCVMAWASIGLYEGDDNSPYSFQVFSDWLNVNNFRTLAVVASATFSNDTPFNSASFSATSFTCQGSVQFWR